MAHEITQERKMQIAAVMHEDVDKIIKYHINEDLPAGFLMDAFRIYTAARELMDWGGSHSIIEALAHSMTELVHLEDEGEREGELTYLPQFINDQTFDLTRLMVFIAKVADNVRD